MDRKIKRNEFNDKKIDYKLKDSGDTKKPNNSEAYNIKVKRGDSGDRADSEERKMLLINKKSGQMKLNMDRTKPTKKDSNYKYLIIEDTEKDTPRKNKDKDSFAKSYSEIRKRIRDKYTFKYNVPVNKSEHLSLYKSGKGGKVFLNRDGNDRVPTDPAKTPTKPLPEETSRINEKQIRPSLGQTDLDKKLDYIIPEIKPEKIPVKPIIRPPRWKINSPKKRRPMIQTVVSKTDAARIFKAVTFVDNINSTPLEIKIPGENIEIKKQQKVSKYTETTPLKLKSKSNLPTVRTIKGKPSKENIKIEDKQPPVVVRKKPVDRKRGRRFRQTSPDSSALEADCPKTEVARWVPASVDPQTKPYYEAWVDTTLTATNIPTKKEKSMYEYQLRLLKSFRRAMAERPQTPDLFYEKFKDERFAGRIKIKQTDRRGNT